MDAILRVAGIMPLRREEIATCYLVFTDYISKCAIITCKLGSCYFVGDQNELGTEQIKVLILAMSK